MSGFRGNKWISWISLFRQTPKELYKIKDVHYSTEYYTSAH